MKKKTLLLSNEITEIGKLPAFVEEIGKELSLPASVASSMNLALEEALSNVIQYAYSERGTSTVKLEAEQEDSSLVFTLTDSGIAFDPTSIPEADTTLSVAERPVGGLGFFLIRSIMDDVRYRRDDGRNILVMTKHLK